MNLWFICLFFSDRRKSRDRIGFEFHNIDWSRWLIITFSCSMLRCSRNNTNKSGGPVSALEDPSMLQIKVNFEKLNFKYKDNLNEFRVEYCSKFVKSVLFALAPMEELTNFRLASKVSMILWTFYCRFEVLFWAYCLMHLTINWSNKRAALFDTSTWKRKYFTTD